MRCRERIAQPVLGDPPEVMLDPINDGNGDPVPVLPHVILGKRDIPFFPTDSEVTRDPPDDVSRVVAQVATGTAVKGDPGGRQLRPKSRPEDKSLADRALRPPPAGPVCSPGQLS